MQSIWCLSHPLYPKHGDSHVCVKNMIRLSNTWRCWLVTVLPLRHFLDILSISNQRKSSFWGGFCSLTSNKLWSVQQSPIKVHSDTMWAHQTTGLKSVPSALWQWRFWLILIQTNRTTFQDIRQYSKAFEKLKQNWSNIKVLVLVQFVVCLITVFIPSSLMTEDRSFIDNNHSLSSYFVKNNWCNWCLDGCQTDTCCFNKQCCLFPFCHEQLISFDFMPLSGLIQIGYLAEKLESCCLSPAALNLTFCSGCLFSFSCSSAVFETKLLSVLDITGLGSALFFPSQKHKHDRILLCRQACHCGCSVCWYLHQLWLGVNVRKCGLCGVKIIIWLVRME